MITYFNKEDGLDYILDFETDYLPIPGHEPVETTGYFWKDKEMYKISVTIVNCEYFYGKPEKCKQISNSIIDNLVQPHSSKFLLEEES